MLLNLRLGDAEDALELVDAREEPGWQVASLRGRSQVYLGEAAVIPFIV